MSHMNHVEAYYLLFTSLTLLLSLVYFGANAYLSLNLKLPPRRREVELDQVTAVIPVYNEDPETFSKVLRSLRKQGVRFIVVGDGCDEPYRRMTTEMGGEFVHLERRSGKREALAHGVKNVRTKFTLLLDSDTLLPEDGVRNLLSLMSEDVGGVGANVKILKGTTISYFSELIERLKEATMRSVSGSGYAVLLNGKCSLYRTELIRPFIQSREFRNPTFMGRSALVGDDKQLTNFVISKGYRALVDFDTVVVTTPPETLRKFALQLLRWARANYYFFLGELRDGTMFKRGPLYVYNFIYTSLLPFILIAFSFVDTYILGSVIVDTNLSDYDVALLNGGHFLLHFPFILAKRLVFAFLIGSPLINVHSMIHLATGIHHVFSIPLRFRYSVILLHVSSYLTSVPFIYSLWRILRDEKVKTLVLGSFGLFIQMFVVIYALLTVWKLDKWLTR